MALSIDDKTIYTPTNKTVTTKKTATNPVKSSTGTYAVGADGQAQKGLSAGSIINTNGGNYKITGVNADGSYISQKVDPTVSGVQGGLSRLDMPPLPTLTPKDSSSGGGNSRYTPPNTTPKNYGVDMTREEIMALPTKGNPGQPVDGDGSWIGDGVSPYAGDEPRQTDGGTGGGFNGLRNDFASSSASDKAEMAAMMEGMLTYIDQMGSQVTNQIRGQMGMDDPETANAIAMIRQQADEIYKEMLEDLNAKGLVQSGIYAEARDRIAKSQGQQVSSFVASRFGDLQNQLNQAMMSMGQMRVGAMSSNMGMVNSNNMNDRNTMASLGAQGLQNDTQLRGQNLQNQQFQQSFDWQKSSDTRDFNYGQQRDAIGDQQFGQQLAASGGGGGGSSLGQMQFDYMVGQDALANRNMGFQAAQQLVAQGQPKTDADYQAIQYDIQYNPLFQDPQVKAYLQNTIQKPVAQPQTNSLGSLFGLDKPSGYAPPYQLHNQR